MLEIEALHAGYGQVKILHGASLKVADRSMTALLGGNGTGKSTMFKAISGLIKPTSGTIRFNGQDITNMRPDRIVRAGLVQVTQGKEAYPNMTVEENLRLGGYVLNKAAKVKAGLERVYTYFPDLKGKRRQNAGLLSGGQLQMLCIGRGLMSSPKMLLLDEPSAALAPQVTMDIFHTINQIRASGMTVLVIEQNVRIALLIADYGYVIRDGTVHIEGPAQELISDDRVRLSYLGGTVADADQQLQQTTT